MPPIGWAWRRACGHAAARASRRLTSQRRCFSTGNVGLGRHDVHCTQKYDVPFSSPRCPLFFSLFFSFSSPVLCTHYYDLPFSLLSLRRCFSTVHVGLARHDVVCTQNYDVPFASLSPFLLH